MILRRGSKFTDKLSSRFMGWVNSIKGRVKRAETVLFKPQISKWKRRKISLLFLTVRIFSKAIWANLHQLLKVNNNSPVACKNKRRNNKNK